METNARQKFIDSIDTAITKIKNKESNFYFYVMNSKGIPSASVGFVYDLVAIFRERGYNAHILHEDDYMTPLWMGGNRDKLPHVKLKDLKITRYDFLFLPEVIVQSFYSDLNQSNIKLPCEVIVLSQVYDLIHHSLDFGTHWYHFGIKNVITTTEAQKHFIEDCMRNLSVQVINPYIHDDFKPSDKPQKPFVLVHSRDQKQGELMAKRFWQMYPQYRWVPFKFLSKCDRSEFAESIRESCLAVWIDEESSFGTFPLECMKSGVPVIGKIPEIMPEWMGDNNEGGYKVRGNGEWVLSKMEIMSKIAAFMDAWLLDNLDESFYSVMAETASKYTKENTAKQTFEVLENLIVDRIEKLNLAKEKANQPVQNA